MENQTCDQCDQCDPFAGLTEAEKDRIAWWRMFGAANPGM